MLVGSDEDLFTSSAYESSVIPGGDNGLGSSSSQYSNLTPLNTPLPQIIYGGLPFEAVMLQGEKERLRQASRHGFRPSVTAQQELRKLGSIGEVIRKKIKYVENKGLCQSSSS